MADKTWGYRIEESRENEQNDQNATIRIENIGIFALCNPYQMRLDLHPLNRIYSTVPYRNSLLSQIRITQMHPAHRMHSNPDIDNRIILPGRIFAPRYSYTVQQMICCNRRVCNYHLITIIIIKLIIIKRENIKLTSHAKMVYQA